MSRFQPALIALTLALAAGTAQAQQPAGRPPVTPYSPPVFSPYLNLVNRGNPGINYYGIVRPEVQANQQFQMLQFGLARTNADLDAAVAASANQANASGQLPDTGHVAGFMTYTRYFNTVNPRGR